jgi:hypothetical protein
MSHLNFSITAPPPAPRRRAYNPRGNVSLRSTSLIGSVATIGFVMAAVFVIVWLI